MTFKTVFLTALATGKRRSELHALIRKGLSWSEDKSSITLRVSPEFVSKTQLGFGSGVIQPICLTSLGDFVGNLPGEMNLCPVRAILTYFRRVKSEGFPRDKVMFFWCPISRDFIVKFLCLLFPVGLRKPLSCVNSEDLNLAKVRAILLELWLLPRPSIIIRPLSLYYRLVPGLATVLFLPFI